MPKTVPKVTQPAPQEPVGPATTTRLDAPHVIGDQEAISTAPEISPEESDMPKAAPADELAGERRELTRLREQLETHARQLAGQLDRQQRELDEREAALNAREAEIEGELRRARLWLDARREELTEREAKVQTQTSQAEERLARIVDAEKQRQALESGELADEEATAAQQAGQLHALSERLATREAQLEAHEQEFHRRQIEDRAAAAAKRRQIDEEAQRQQQAAAVERQTLERRRMELRQLSHRLLGQCAAYREKLQSDAEQLTAALAEAQSRQRGVARKLADAKARLDEREGQLVKTEMELARRRSETTDEQLNLAAQRERLMREVAQAEADLDQRRQRDETLLARKKLALRRQSESLRSRRDAVEALRDELSQKQREVLELRVATQELYSELTGAFAPTALAAALAQAQAQLADHYRDELAQLNERKREIESLVYKLAQRHEQLARLAGSPAARSRVSLSQTALSQTARRPRMAAISSPAGRL